MYRKKNTDIVISSRLRDKYQDSQLSGKQSAHFGHVVIITVDTVIHLFFTVLPLAWAVWRRRSYAGHSSGQGRCPGLICRTKIGNNNGNDNVNNSDYTRYNSNKPTFNGITFLQYVPLSSMWNKDNQTIHQSRTDSVLVYSFRKPLHRNNIQNNPPISNHNYKTDI